MQITKKTGVFTIKRRNMDSIVIASKDNGEAQAIKESLGENQDVAIVTSEEEIGQYLRTTRLLLLDHSFNEKVDTPLLTNIIKKSPFPVLFLTAPDDGSYAVEAMKHGAWNFIVKSGNYHPMLKHTVQRAIDEFDEKQEMKQTVPALKKRVEELEAELNFDNVAIGFNVTYLLDALNAIEGDSVVMALKDTATRNLRAWLDSRWFIP